MNKTLDLKIWPDSVLNKKSSLVTKFDETLNNIVTAMKEVMIQAQGVGIAAPQIGINKQIISYKVSNSEEYLINSKIIEFSEEKQEIKEGCLSFPGVYILAERSKIISVKYQNKEGEELEKDFSGFAAQMIQHEVDHLNGVVFTKFLSKLKRDIVNRKMSKLKKEVELRWKEYQKLAKLQKYDLNLKPNQDIGIPITQKPTGQSTEIYNFNEE